MKTMQMFVITPLVIAASLVSGCATHIQTEIIQNPPLKEKFAAFSHFEMPKISLAKPYAGEGSNDKALAKIQENVSLKIEPTLAGWNSTGAAAMPKRTLLIEPEVTELKFINGNARFWVGPLAGSSAVILHAKITEKETGKVIATPIFYSRAEAWGGAFSIGTTDNIMLVRIAGRRTDYISANYGAAIGGPSGAEPQKK